jgi:hypothetical protein
VYCFRAVLEINSDYFSKQHQPNSLCNGLAGYFLWKTNFLNYNLGENLQRASQISEACTILGSHSNFRPIV